MKRLFIALCCLSLPACWQKMGVQPSYRPLQEDAEGRPASRSPLAGTVARGQLRTDTVLFQGKDAEGKLVDEFPYEITPAVLARGKERYGVYCSMCHGLAGRGDGRIVQRGFIKPPSYLENSRGYALKGKKISLKEVPHGYIFDVITRGYGAMPDHAELVPVNDRWAITAYVRLLQTAKEEKK